MFVSSIRALALLALAGFTLIHLVDAACGVTGHKEFNANGLPQGENGELYCAVRCILKGQYCNTNNAGTFVYPVEARGPSQSDSTNLTAYYGDDISNWCVGLVQDFTKVFNAEVSNVEEDNGNIESTFHLTTSVDPSSQTSFNLPLFWDTNSATTMRFMFAEASVFNQKLPWDVSNVISFYGMFSDATAFNQLLLWDTKSATDMSNMFVNAQAFNQDISSWNTSSVLSFYGMFEIANAFSHDISSWSVGASCDFSFAFYGATKFNQNLNRWEQQLVGKDCGSGAAPNVYLMFRYSGCPVQVATIPGDFCQVAPSAMPSTSSIPSSVPSASPSTYPTKSPTRRPTKKPTKPRVFNVRTCLADAVKHCSCKKRTIKNQCFNVLMTACKAKYVAAGGAVNKFISLAKAAARHRKCDIDEDSG
jgi:surface protein